MNQFILV